MEERVIPRKFNGRLLWALGLLLAWGCVLYLFLKTNGRLGVADLLRYRPSLPLLAALILCGLFVLKSVDFVLHSGVLYAAGGIMFSTPAALLLSVLGALIMSVIPYFMGRSLGQPVLHHIAERYPRFRVIEHIRSRNQLIIALLIRAVGLPLAAAGMYMGAAGFRFDRYILGSLLGLLPSAVCFTVMGESAGDLASPVFWIALGVHLLTALLSLLIYRRLLRR